MDNKQQKLINEKLKSQSTDKITYSKNIFKGSIIAIFIAVTPFLFYLYEYVPDNENWTTSFGTVSSGHFGSVQIGLWVFLMKAIPLILLFIWFFTCRHWWYHALLVPIAMYSYQSIGVMNEELYFIDEFQLVHLVPIMGIIVPSIYLVRARLFNSINSAGQTMQDLEDELTFRPKTFWGKVKQYF